MKPLLSSTITRRKFLKGATAFGIGMTFAPQLVWGAKQKKLNLYNWDTYIGENTVSDFAKKFGMKVQYDLYANNEELFAKLKEGNPGFDVIWPSDYMVEALIAIGRLAPIDHSKLPNMKNIDPDPNFSNPAFNPGLKYGVPYMWGTMGVGYRKSKVKKPPTSWKVLFESDEYSNRIALLDDPRAVIGIVLKYLGYSVYPREIEDVIYEHPAVKLCAVIGKPDKKKGEIPIAYIVLKEGASATEEELINYVKERVAPYKRIRGVVFRRELPLTVVGKVLKRTLMKDVLNEAKNTM